MLSETGMMDGRPLRFGMSTTVLREHTVAHALRRIAGVGYASAEIWLWHMEQQAERPEGLGRLARELGLALTVHAPAGEDVNPTDTDPALAAHSRRRIETAFQTAAALGARLVVVHPGRRSGEAHPPPAAWEALLGWAAELDRLADRLQLTVGLELMENLPLEIFCRPEDAVRLMAHPFERLKLTVDLAHLNTHGDPPALLEQIQPAWIAHAHLSDNAPHRVHLPLGEGEMDVASALAALEQRYDGLVSIEGSIPGEGEMVLKRSLTYLRKLGFA